MLLGIADVTERRQLEQQREEFSHELEQKVSEHTGQLQQANRAIGRHGGAKKARRSASSVAKNGEHGRLPLIMADPNQITQVLLNLSVNARDAMPDGGTITIKTLVSQEEGFQEPAELKAERYVCVEVTDTGKGMDENIRSRIFEPFFTTKGIGQGIGLGLVVVYGIVKSHNGFIQVESQPMVGTTFRLHFPVHSAQGE